MGGVGVEKLKIHPKLRLESKVDVFLVVKWLWSYQHPIPKFMYIYICMVFWVFIENTLGSTVSSLPGQIFRSCQSLRWQVYDLVTEGLLGVRPLEDREALAFVERAAVGANVVRRLTGQERNWWGSGWGLWDLLGLWILLGAAMKNDVFFLSLNSFEGKVHQHFLNLKLRSLAQICCQFVVLQLGDSPVSNWAQSTARLQQPM